jgi:hypothetical protein
MGSADATQAVPWWRGWTPVLALPLPVVVFTPAEVPRWLFMWLLALAIYFSFKWLTWRRTPVRRVAWWQHAGYVLAWPGLDSRAFLQLKRSPALRPTAGEWTFAVCKFLLGAAIVWGAARVVPDGQDILRAWVGMVGMSFLLHFGSFHLSSCAWRGIGVDARTLMNWPIASVSVSEFWGRRWNTAFRDLTHRFLFRPLTAKLGPRWAVAAGFVFSGLIHELIISVPAGGGHGGPTIFFVLQGLALLVERSKLGQTVGLGAGVRGLLFTGLVLTTPAFLLFHPPFVRNVVLPFMQALGAT